LIKKLPKWVEYGAFLLSVLAGSINVVGLMGFEHQAISHVSGTVSRLGESFVDSTSSSLHLLFILLSFLLGAIISGLAIENTTLKIGRNYSFLLLIETFLLLFSLYSLNNNLSLGHYFASAACGVQNALFTTYSGAILRTTHLTGIFTDLGLMIGQGLKSKSLDKRKLILLLLIIMGFLTGGSIGAALYLEVQFNAILFPAILSFILSIAYWIYSKSKKCIT